MSKIDLTNKEEIFENPYESNIASYKKSAKIDLIIEDEI